jgi:hypothetical protein
MKHGSSGPREFMRGLFDLNVPTQLPRISSFGLGFQVLLVRAQIDENLPVEGVVGKADSAQR